VPGDGAAEDVREHRGEQDGLQHHVEELFRVAAHLRHGPPRHGQGLADGLGGGDVPADGGGGRGGHCSSSSVPWPVRARNTSSRLGLATLTDAIGIPAVRSAISTSAAESARSSGALSRPFSGLSTGSTPSTRRTVVAAPGTWAGSVRASWSVEAPTVVFSSSGVPSAT